MMLIPDGPLCVYEWMGSCLGLAGAGLLSLNVKASPSAGFEIVDSERDNPATSGER